MYKIIVLSILASFFIFSCQDNKSNRYKIDYKSYYHNGQDWKSRRVTLYENDIVYSATEVPVHYYLAKNSNGSTNTIDSLYNDNKRERIIEIEFENIDRKDLLEEEYTERSYEDAVKYLAFSIDKDFQVVTSNNDTIKCSGVHFERNFKVAPFKRVLLYFSNINPDENINLLYQDNLFGNGSLYFNFNETPLKL